MGVWEGLANASGDGVVSRDGSDSLDDETSSTIIQHRVITMPQSIRNKIITHSYNLE